MRDFDTKFVTRQACCDCVGGYPSALVRRGIMSNNRMISARSSPISSLLRAHGVLSGVLLALALVAPSVHGETPTETIQPSGIVIHHSALSHADMAEFPGPTDAAVIDSLHAKRGFGISCGGRTYHIGYHYVILSDGEVQPGRPENCMGAHASGHNDSLGICLIGNFSTRANPDGQLGNVQPTQAQIRSLVTLVKDLKRKYNIPCDRIQRHQDLKPETLCPGDRLPWKDIQPQIDCRAEE